MIQRICPICNGAMKGKHFCWNCKSWVKEPYVQNVGYYLNERHPENEVNCSYHGTGSDGVKWSVLGSEKTGGEKSRGTGRAAGTATETKNTTGYGTVEGQTASSGMAGWEIQNIPSQTGGERRKAGSIWRLFWVLFIGTNVVILAFAVYVINKAVEQRAEENNYQEAFQEEWSVDYGEDMEGEDWYDEDWEDTLREVEDAEVIEEGIACNGDGHFPVSGVDLKALVEELLPDYGLGDSQVDEYSYNEEYSDDDGNVTSTFFSYYVDFNFGEGWDEGLGEYLELDYDTATKELHGVNLVLEDKEVLIRLSLDILRSIEKMSGQPEGIWSASVERDMPGVMERKDGYGLMAGDISIRGYYYEGSYCFSIDFVQ